MEKKKNNAKYERYIKEGRGQNELENYIPWLKISDFSSMGRATRIHGLKTKRIHHLHSDNQLRAFLLFEWSDKVVDIRESYPLLDLMEVIDKKNDLRLDKFRDKKSGEQYVLTTNFLLTLKDQRGNISYAARTIKNASDLNKKIVLDKLEIERRYWLAKGIDWKIITNKEQNRQYCKNIEWIRETLIEGASDNLYMEALGEKLISTFMKGNNKKAKNIMKEFEDANKLDKGMGLYIFRHLIGTKKILVDMREKINVNRNVQDLIIKLN